MDIRSFFHNCKAGKQIQAVKEKVRIDQGLHQRIFSLGQCHLDGHIFELQLMYLLGQLQLILQCRDLLQDRMFHVNKRRGQNIDFRIICFVKQ